MPDRSNGSPPLDTCENVGCYAILPLAEHTNPAGDVHTLCPRHGRLHENGEELRFDRKTSIVEDANNA